MLPWLFGFFVLVNGLSYWGASLTAFPQTIFYNASNAFYYFKIQFPVAILGALFDSFSFFVTMRIIRSAIRSTSAARFVGYLAIDLMIAIVATFWVLFVFSFSSWLIRLTEGSELVAELGVRQDVYQERLQSALRNPWGSKRNIYFGIVMGVSAMLPTCFHLYTALKAIFRIESKRLERIEGRVSDWFVSKLIKLGRSHDSG